MSSFFKAEVWKEGEAIISICAAYKMTVLTIYVHIHIVVLQVATKLFHPVYA